MRQHKNLTALLLISFMTAGLLGGCTGTQPAATSVPAATSAAATSASAAASAAPTPAASPGLTEEALEHVTLDWYIIENIQKDQDMVWEKLNEYFGETISATVNYHPIPADEYSTKVSTFVSSGQTMDVVNSSSQLPYADYAQRGAFLPLNDLLDAYAPQTKALIPESFWNAMVINGQIYGIPSYKDSCNILGVIYNETLMNAIGADVTPLANTWVSLYDVIPTFYGIQEKRAAAFPEDAEIPVTREFADPYWYSQYEVINGLAVVNIPGIDAFAGMGSGEKVFNLYATDEYRKYCNTIKQLVDDNIMPFDAWNFDPERVYTLEGKIAVLGYGQGYIHVNKDYASNDFDAALMPNKNTVATTNYLHAAVSCVSATSKNPERAMMLLELANTDNFVATATRFGIEGEHYTKQADGRLDFAGTRNGDASDRGYYTWYGAQIGSFMYASIPNTYPADFQQRMMEANEQAISETNMGFIFDPTPVQNEVAACSSVIGEYTINFKFGFVENVDEVLDEFVAKLEASGAQKVVDEAQAQLTAWRASQGRTTAQ